MPSISQVAAATRSHLDLLLLADPSPTQIAAAVDSGLLFVAQEGSVTVAAAVIAPGIDGAIELKAIAVQTASQHRGIGRQMVDYIFEYARARGFREVRVGTGNSSLGPLKFYQKLGFRLQGIVPDYFSDRVPPIVEDGLPCRDLVRLVWTAEGNSPVAHPIPSSSAPPAPATVVQRQLEAFNARDLDALLAIYAGDAELFEHPAKLLARGTSELRERFAVRFREANLHAALRQRIVMDPFVIDHETVTRTFPEGPGTIDLIMTYEIRHGLIARAWTLAGARTLAPSSPQS